MENRKTECSIWEKCFLTIKSVFDKVTVNNVMKKVTICTDIRGKILQRQKKETDRCQKM